MSFNIPIALAVSIGVLGACALYKQSNYNKNQHLHSQTRYVTSETQNYVIINPARVYKYAIPTSSFDEIEKAYKRDLLENHKQKEYIDKILKEYLEKNPIVHKRVVIDTKGWVADIDIQTNVNSTTLIFKEI